MNDTPLIVLYEDACAAIEYILRHFGVKEGECFTLPDGNCVGIKCMHSIEKDKE